MAISSLFLIWQEFRVLSLHRMQFKESNQVTYTTQFAMLQAISWESDQTKHMFVHTLLCCYIPHLALR